MTDRPLRVGVIGVGYLGAPYETAFPMTVTCITHRRNPWFFNDFTGITRPLLEMPGAALTTTGLSRFLPAIVDYRYVDSVTNRRVFRGGGW